MEAYEGQYGTTIRVIADEVNVPVSSKQVKKGDILKIFSLDGMYCKCKDEEGDIVFIAAWTEVENCSYQISQV